MAEDAGEAIAGPAAAEADPRLGTSIAGYRITSVLGRGGMGVVYLARDLSLDRNVALKVLPADLADDELFRRRFHREARLAASLDHPHVVPVYAAGEEVGVLYLAMRYVPGTDLRALLDREGTLPLPRALPVLSQVAQALDAAHERGLVHRDVKPANILLGEREPPHAYLGDFGLTRLRSAQGETTATGQFLGTVDYCAPEQVEGRALDGRADQYALASVAFRCLTGSPPFAGRETMAVLWAKLSEPPPKPLSVRPDLPPALDDALARAMAVDPDDRYPTCFGLVKALTRAAGDSRALSLPSPRPGTEKARAGSPTIRHRRWGIAGLLVAGAMALALSIALVVSRDDVAPPPRDGGDRKVPAPVDNAVARIDAETGRVEVIARGIVQGTDVAVGQGGVWVVTVPGPGVTHLDPETGMVETPVAFDCIASALRSEIVVASGAVWVVRGGDCGVAKVNPATDKEASAVPIPTASGDDVDARIAAGMGKIWILGSGGLSRVDPFLARVEQTADGIDGDDITVGEVAVWIADGLRKSVVRVDPDTLETVDTFELQTTPDELAVSEERIWVLNAEAGTVTPVGRADGDVGDPIRVGSDPMSIDAGFGFVWVVSHGDGTVIRIDPETRRTTTIDVGGPPTSLAIDPETKTVWVAISRCIGPGCRL